MTQKSNQQLKYPADWQRAKKANRKISVLTCYDATTAKIISNTKLDAILIGDSLGMVIQGQNSTLSVTMNDVIYHTRMVRRGAPGHFLIADMPFGSFQACVKDGVRNGLRLMRKSKADAVKLEGAQKQTLKIISKLVNAGVPVMGHIGLTPQSFMNTSGFRLQGKTDQDRERILHEALLLEEAGCFAIVLELLSATLTHEITKAIKIPTIGIGAGPDADGQVLVIQDLLGMFPDFKPRHVKQYANLSLTIAEATQQYHDDIIQGKFPGSENTFN